MKESYHGRIANAGGQEVKAVYPRQGEKKPKIASYAGNGVSGGFKSKKKAGK